MEDRSPIKSEKKELSLWQAFFATHPFFGPISRSVVRDIFQKFKKLIHKDVAKKQVMPFHLLPVDQFFQAQMFTGIKSKTIIKNKFLEAIHTKRVNTDEIRTLMQQEQAPLVIRELVQNKQISFAEGRRLAELYANVTEKAYEENKLLPRRHYIEKSLDTDKIQKLYDLLIHGLKNVSEESSANEYSEITAFMQDKQFPSIVLGLLDSPLASNLQLQQLITIWEYYQLTQNRIVKDIQDEQVIKLAKHCEIVEIDALFARDELTDQADKFVMTLLKELDESAEAKNPSVFKNRGDIQKFTDLMSELPLSEQTFSIIKVEKGSPLTTAVTYEDAIYQLPLHLIPQHYSVDTAYDYYMVPSCGMRNAIGIMRYGKNYVPVYSQIGVKSMADMEEGYRKYHARLGFLFHPNVADVGEVHNSKDDTHHGVGGHDKYHSDVVSAIPPYARETLLYLADIVRQTTNNEWSQEIWTWVDSDYRYFKFNPDKVDSSNFDPTVEFCAMLDTAQDEGEYPYGMLLLASNDGDVTPVGIIAFVDMVQNPKRWQQMGIEPEKLPSARQIVSEDEIKKNHRLKYYRGLDYAHYYQKIKNILNLYPQATKLHPAAQNLFLITLLTKDVSNESALQLYDLLQLATTLNCVKFSKNSANNIKVEFFDNKFSYLPLSVDRETDSLLTMARFCEWSKRLKINLTPNHYKSIYELINELGMKKMDFSWFETIEKNQPIIMELIFTYALSQAEPNESERSLLFLRLEKAIQESDFKSVMDLLNKKTFLLSKKPENLTKTQFTFYQACKLMKNAKPDHVKLMALFSQLQSQSAKAAEKKPKF